MRTLKGVLPRDTLSHNFLINWNTLSHNLYQKRTPCRIIFTVKAVAYQRGGMGGSGPHTFQKVGHRDSHENVIKLVGVGVGQICQEVVSEILEKQATNCFSRVGGKVLVS